MSLFVNNLMNYFENMLAGLVGIEPTPSVSKTEMISISPKPDINILPFAGGKPRNGLRVSSVVEQRLYTT